MHKIHSSSKSFTRQNYEITEILSHTTVWETFLLQMSIYLGKACTVASVRPDISKERFQAADLWPDGNCIFFDLEDR